MKVFQLLTRVGSSVCIYEVYTEVTTTIKTKTKTILSLFYASLDIIIVVLSQYQIKLYHRVNNIFYKLCRTTQSIPIIRCVFTRSYNIMETSSR